MKAFQVRGHLSGPTDLGMVETPEQGLKRPGEDVFFRDPGLARDPQAAPQIQDKEIQGQVGFQAGADAGPQGLVHVQGEHGVHGFFMGEAGDVVEGAAAAGLKFRALRVQEIQGGGLFQDAAQFLENRDVAQVFIRLRPGLPKVP